MLSNSVVSNCIDIDTYYSKKAFQRYITTTDTIDKIPYYSNMYLNCQVEHTNRQISISRTQDTIDNCPFLC